MPFHRRKKEEQKNSRGKEQLMKSCCSLSNMSIKGSVETQTHFPMSQVQVARTKVIVLNELKFLILVIMTRRIFAGLIVLAALAAGAPAEKRCSCAGVWYFFFSFFSLSFSSNSKSETIMSGSELTK